MLFLSCNSSTWPIGYGEGEESVVEGLGIMENWGLWWLLVVWKKF